jgi:phosphopantothenoylcysteine decarboxylase / phosphopantothenate---cysteine ligase
MRSKSVLLGITGGIAAYKSAELCRLFVKAGASVQVVMSEAACEFITPLTMETLSGRPVKVRMFEKHVRGVEHIALADEADVFVVAPATADFLARAASGRASDLISAVMLAYQGPVLAAPAMNTHMWENPATRRNLAILSDEHRWHFAMPGSGALACGWTGPGRMAAPETIFEAVRALFKMDLESRRIVVSAGPTVEDLDPVRFISNRSSGKMGYAVAEVAARRGAAVTLVSGPTALPCPRGVVRVDVRSALEMEQAVNEAAEGSDAVVMAAAVSDFRPASPSPVKLKKTPGETSNSVDLVQNPDILAGLSKRFASPPPVLVGFALETEDLLENANKKLASKGAHLVVANLASAGFGGDATEALIIDREGRTEETGPLTKVALAEKILDAVAARLGGPAK